MPQEINLKNAKCSAFSLVAPVQFLRKEGADDGNNFLIEAYTGVTVERWWGTLAIEVAGIKAAKKIPVFKDHNSTYIVGHSNNTYKDGSFFVEGTFSQVTETAKEVKGLAEEEFPWQASIGVRALKIMSIEKDSKMTVNGKTLKGPAEVWLESEVFETSFVPFGADKNTSVAMFSQFTETEQPPSGSDTTHNTHLKKEEKAMSITLEELKTEAPDLLAQIQTDAKAAGYDEGLTAGVTGERERVAAILAVENTDDAARKQAIDEGLSEDAAYKLFFMAEKKKKKESLETFQGSAPDSVGAQGSKSGGNDGESFMSVVTAYQKENGGTRTDALKAVATKNPALHKAWLASINQRPDTA